MKWPCQTKLYGRRVCSAVLSLLHHPGETWGGLPMKHTKVVSITYTRVISLTGADTNQDCGYRNTYRIRPEKENPLNCVDSDIFQLERYMIYPNPLWQQYGILGGAYLRSWSEILHCFPLSEIWELILVGKMVLIYYKSVVEILNLFMIWGRLPF